MYTFQNELKPWIEKGFLDKIPLYISVIDREYHILYANNAFEGKFGEWKGQKCFNIYKKRESTCKECNLADAFQDGKSRVNEEAGYDRNGDLIHQIKYTIPWKGEAESIDYLVEVSVDITELKNIRQEYQLLFDQVPCNILIIDRNFKIIKANKEATKMVGTISGQHCYKALKERETQCSECTARQTFQDGLLHTGYHIWKTKGEKIRHLHVITVPLRLDGTKFDTVMEMAVDITPTIKLEDKLRVAHNYYKSLINTSRDGIIGVNNKGKVTIFNPAARKLFGVKDDQIISRDELHSILPPGFLAKVSGGGEQVYLPEVELKRNDGGIFPARLVGNILLDEGTPIGMAFSVQDISRLKRLENEKIEAERMAIVGQTVAGLAHGIKNLVYALEGGMYMMSSGVEHSDIKRVQKGMETLSRNIERISIFSKSFLNFSKDICITPKLCSPKKIAEEVIEAFEVRANEHQIKLNLEATPGLEPISLDYEKMHECITNIIGNAVDACISSEKKNKKWVKIRMHEDSRVVNFEFIDNGCGMDPDTQKKVFHKFFTTKGLDGTGLGLMMAKKIVHEHGGAIDLVSEFEKGTKIRIHLPRRRLPRIRFNEE